MQFGSKLAFSCQILAHNGMSALRDPGECEDGF